MAMGVPEELLLSDVWYCHNHQRNPRFASLLADPLKQPVYSHLARAEMVCPPTGITPILSVSLSSVDVIKDLEPSTTISGQLSGFMR